MVMGMIIHLLYEEGFVEQVQFLEAKIESFRQKNFIWPLEVQRDTQ